MAKYRINPITGKLDIVGEGLKASTYDIDENNIIDKAETLDDGAGNTATAANTKDAINKKHNQNTDTSLGIQTADINMGGFSLTDVDTLYGETAVLKVRNVSGVTLTKGKAVYVTGEAVNLVTVALCDCTDKDKMHASGLVLLDIADNNNGYIVIAGVLRMNTSSLTGAVKERVYVQVDGSIDTVEPTSGSVQRIGKLAKKASGNGGVIQVSIRGRKSIFAAANEHPILRMGNDVGHKMIEFKNYANAQKGYIDEDGNFKIDGNLTDGVNASSPANIKSAIDLKHNRSHSIVSSSDHNDKADFIDGPLSPTLLTGGVLSAGTNANTFKVSALTALLRTSNSLTAALEKVALSEQDNIAIPVVDTSYYVSLNYGSPCTINPVTSRSNGNNNLGIGRIIRDNNNIIHYSNTGNRLVSGVHKLHKRASELRDLEMVDGVAITDKGSKKLSISSTVFYKGINRLVFSGFDSSGTDKFTYVYYNGSAWVYIIDQTDINVDQYNNIASGLVTCNKYKCDWVYVHPDDGHVYVVYGQDNTTKANILLTTVPEVPDLVDKFGVLIGRIIIDGGVVAFNETQTLETTTFRASTVTDHNDLSSLQGGTTDEYYHLTSSEHSALHSQNSDTALRTDKVTVDENGHTTISGELKIKVYSQNEEPTLSSNQMLALWIDANDSNRVRLIFRRGSGDQVSIELT